MKSSITTKSGALYAMGQEAEKIFKIKRDIEDLFDYLNITKLWLPSVTYEKHFHPQKVDSEHREGHLCHAGCLPFFDNIDAFNNNIYCGFNRVHRLEPLRNMDPNNRLESFEMAEIIITGTKAYTEMKYLEIKQIITEFLSGYVEGEWRKAEDSFIKAKNKEEFIVENGGNQIAVSSGNRHGAFFSSKRGMDGYSCCFGIGIERVYQSTKEVEV